MTDTHDPPPSESRRGVGGCPVDHHFSMMNDDLIANPYGNFAAVREQRVFYAEALDVYVVTRNADIEEILTDPVSFSSSVVLDSLTPPSPAARAIIEEASVYRPPNLINADGERHRMVRRFVHDAMSPKRLRALEPKIREYARPIVEAMIAAGKADLVSTLSFPLPAFVGLSLLGFPAEDFERIKAWSKDRLTFTYGKSPDPEAETNTARSVAAFWRYTNDLVQKRIAEPRDDLVSDLVRHHLEMPEEFTPRDVATVLFEMALAAHETTTNQLSNVVRRLLEHREQWQELVADPSLIPNAIEEVMRYDGSVLAWRRRTTKPVQIGGVDVPAGVTLLLLFGAANHDPANFPDPESFDIHRTGANRHFTFGRGVHFCQGAPLARTEMRVVLELLTQLAPEVVLVPGQDFKFYPNMFLRGPASLMLDFSACKAAAHA